MSSESSYTPQNRALIKDPAVVAEFDNLAAQLKRGPLRVVYQATPADPTGTASTSGAMLGLSGSITPKTTGAIFVQISGNLTNSTAAAGDGAKAQIRTGTGTPPINGGALAGTPAGNQVSSVLERATANDLQSFCCQAIVTGLALNAAYWIDLALAAIVGGTGVASNLSVTAFEL